MPLRPLPAARLLAFLYLLAIGLYAAQLLLTGHWMMAAGMACLGVVTVFALRQMSPQGPGAPRRLLLAADGRLHVACVGGVVEQVDLAGESLWLGSTVLLVLRAPGRSHRVLLGHGNLDPGALASLRRRLRGAATMLPATAVNSGATHPQRSSPIEQFTRGNTG